MLKRFLFILAILLVSLFDVVVAQPMQQAEIHQEEKSFVRKSNIAFSGQYWIYLPDGYAERTTQNWPVLLYLHSSDARSEDLQKVKQEGMPFVLRSGTKIPFIVVAPLCAPDEWWDSRWSIENLNVLLDEVIGSYRVDANRIYLTGWSMGGAGSWKLASSFPARFAAVAPIAGKSQLKYVLPLRNTPVWAFHGDKDSVVPVAESQKMVDALNKIGGDARLTVFSNSNHDVWSQVYNDPLFFSWLLQHSKIQKA
jgi:predicted peptidase